MEQGFRGYNLELSIIEYQSLCALITELHLSQSAHHISSHLFAYLLPLCRVLVVGLVCAHARVLMLSAGAVVSSCVLLFCATVEALK